MGIIGLIGYSHTRDRSIDKSLDIFNEVSLVLLLYIVILFTPFVTDPEARFDVGYVGCVTLCLGVAVNLVMMIFEPLRSFNIRIRRRFANKIARK